MIYLSGQMSHSEFIEKIPNDPNDLFWTHLELLRKCKFVGQLHTLLHKNLVSSQEMRFKRVIVSGVIQKPMPYLQYVTTPLKGVKQDALKIQQTVSKPVPNLTKVVQSEANGNAAGIQANRTGIYTILFYFFSVFILIQYKVIFLILI